MYGVSIFPHAINYVLRTAMASLEGVYDPEDNFRNGGRETDASSLLNMHHNPCKPQVSALANPASAVSTSFREGMTVQLHSLSATNLNGKIGRCGRFKKGRYAVLLDNGKRKVAVPSSDYLFNEQFTNKKIKYIEVLFNIVQN